MTNFQHVLEYVSKFYPRPAEMNQVRITLTLYLVDWRSAIERGRPVTDIRWQVSDIGPAPSDPRVRQILLEGTTKTTPDFSSMHDASLAIKDNVCRLAADDAAIVDFVIDRVANKSEQQLIQLVSSTFPLMTQPVTAPLNLVALAARYNSGHRRHGHGEQ